MPQPVRVGVLDDLVEGPPTPNDSARWITYAVDELRAAGRFDREVEVVHAHGLGLPAGTAAAVTRAYRALVEQDVLLVAGPAIGDNALVATPLAEQHRLPTLNWAGTERARGEHMFHLQVGSHEDESLVMARHLAGLGVGRVGVVHDRSPIGRRHLLFLQAEAEALGLQVCAVTSLAPLAEEAGEEVAAVVSTEPDAVVYLGLGISAAAVGRALTASGWAGPRMMNTAGIRGHDPRFARLVDGWLYVDMYADDNATLRELLQRAEVRVTGPLAAAKGYDLGRLVAHGLASAPELTRDGVRQGLELVKWLPAAEGHAGTLLGFGHHDHGALHGRYLVVRQWQAGVSVQAPVTTSC